MERRIRLIVLPLCLLSVVAGVAAGGDADRAATDRPIAAVISIHTDAIDRGIRVRVRGVVTYMFGDGSACALQDDSGGLWCTLPRDLPEAVRATIHVGEEIEVEGSMDRGGFSPLLLATEATAIGPQPLPAPIPGDVSRLFAAADHCRRVELTGTVQAYRQHEDSLNLVVASGRRRLGVKLARSLFAGEPDDLLDATVRVVGVVADIRNTRGEFLRPTLCVGRREDFEIVEPPRSAPFDSEAVPLESIGQFRAAPMTDQRIHTAGVVTLSVPGEFFYLQQGLAGVRAETTAPEPPQVGEQIEVAGFLDLERQIGGLTEVLFRRVHDGPATTPPQPLHMTPTEIVSVNATARRLGRMARPGNYHGCLISFPATLKEVRTPQDGWCQLLLDDGKSLLNALLPAADYGRAREMQPGTQIAVTGVIEITFQHQPGLAAVSDPTVKGIDVLLRSIADISVVRTPSWWTPRRLLAALATSAALSAAAFAWVLMLRRQVAIQAGRLSEEVAARREAAAEYEITLRERARIAANLHDTILQTVTGIGFQLKAGLAVGDQRDSAASRLYRHVQLAQSMVDHASAQLRGTVWSLRSLPLDGGSFRESLESLVDRLGDGQEARVSLAFEGDLPTIPDFVAGNLLLVIQEAIHNALTHASASRIEVSVAGPPSTDGLQIVIQDDGCGFDLASRAGPSSGHFGLEGMRERMERLKGALEVTSRPGGGTTVRAMIGSTQMQASLPDWAMGDSGRPSP